MKQRIRSPTDEREKKENDKPRRLHNKENERRSQNRSKTSRHITACFSFGFLSEGSKKTENSESAVLVNKHYGIFPEQHYGTSDTCYRHWRRLRPLGRHQPHGGLRK